MNARRLAACRVMLALAMLSQAGARPGAQTWAPTRTADGRPDLEGVWVNNSATPLERPDALKNKPYFTDDEVRELTARAARFVRDSGNDFAGGDNFFLAVLANRPGYKNANATGGANEMVDRIFEKRTSLIVDPPDGRIPPWTPEGRRRWDVQRQSALAASPEGPESLPNFYRCITYGVPRLGGNSTDYSNYFQIVQTRDHFVLYGEAVHDARIVPLDGRAHLPPEVRSWNGDSVGRFDGNTLVVDTTNFSAKSRFMGAADGLHLTERFTRVAPDTIDYEITLDDPTTWTRPWTAVIHLRRSMESMYEFACHEGSLDIIRGVLSGARAGERAAADAAKRRPQ